MFGGAKSCCSPHGHCKTKTPSSKNSERECKQIAFDHHLAGNFHIELPLVAAIKMESPVPTIEALEHGRGDILVEPSPPDLQILHSTFLI